MNLVNVAIVGTGRISDLHAPGYLKNEKARIYAVCDIEEDKAQIKGKEWGVTANNVYSDYDKMLLNDEIDAVELLIPHHLHKEFTVKALEAGKHVSVQKPMANSITECKEMIDVAQRSGMKLIIYSSRWSFRYR